MREKRLKVGLVSHRFMGSKQDTIKKTCELIKKCASKKADLICLQELHQNEYFCQSEDVSKFDLASEFDKDIEFWSSVAKENNVVLVTSLFEKRAKGLYHNTSVVFEKDGNIAGKYRKMHIPDDPGFYEKFYFTPGDLGFKPIKTSVGNLGVLICWDQWYPEAARIMALNGAEILIYPTAIGWFEEDSKEDKDMQLNAWLGIQKSHSIANAIPVVGINRIGFEPSSEKHKGIKFWGHSFVFGAGGVSLFSSNESDELSEVVEVDLNKTEELRRWWPFLRDRRIDCYSDILKRYKD